MFWDLAITPLGFLTFLKACKFLKLPPIVCLGRLKEVFKPELKHFEFFSSIGMTGCMANAFFSMLGRFKFLVS